MKVYAIKNGSFFEDQLESLNQLKSVEGESDFIWIDTVDPNSKELKFTSKLLGEDVKTSELIKNGLPLPRYRISNNLVIMSFSVVSWNEKFLTFPIYIFVGQKTMWTFRTAESSEPVDYVLQNLETTSNMTPVQLLNELLLEIANSNLEVLVQLREIIENLEEKAIDEPSNKQTLKRVFDLKRQLAHFYRLVSSEKQLITELKDGFIPKIKVSKSELVVLNDAMSSLTQELEFLNYYDSSLDGVLRLQELGSIHKLDVRVINLTIIIAVLTVLILLIDIGLLDLLLGG